jgi:glycosyltransferase involved in cell wall biosynthesis
MIPGYPTWHERELRERAAAAGVQRDVYFPGWVGGAEIEGLWELAAGFVFPSLYEGFGLPVLEAMARGVPVACSNASSLPEVAGEAALLFDPRDEAGIAAAIERLLGDAAEAERLRAAGLERVRRFTWERAAELTLASYERALAPRAPGAPRSPESPGAPRAPESPRSPEAPEAPRAPESPGSPEA